MKLHSQKTSIPCAGLATLLCLTVTASLSAQIVTSVTYTGSGPINNAANWSGNILPGKSPNGGLVSSTDSLESSWTGNQWSTLDIRHTGGFLFDAADNGLFLNQGAVYELETDNDYSNIDLEISGTLDLWANAGTSSEVRIISGRVLMLPC